MSSQDHKQALPPGFHLGSYRVVRVLGVGGFGITYLCDHAGLGVQVAVKEYLPNEIAVRDGTAVQPKSAGDREGFDWGLSRFLDEARTLARFEHPNVVRVRDCFEANSTAYIVMDYEDGESLDRLLQRLGTLTEAQLKRVVLPVAEGLREVHAAGFLHRDVKPSNIFVRRSDESPVLLDFGSARQALGRKTRSMTAIASAGYSPPEQYESQGTQGAWTDIYALSALCYRAITGEVPVEAPRRTGEVARQRADPQEQLAASGVAGYSSGFLEAVDGGLRLIETERPGCLDDWLARMEGSIAARNRQAPRRDPAPLHEHLQRHRAIARLRLARMAESAPAGTADLARRRGGTVERKHVDIDESMIRAIAKQAEAERPTPPGTRTTRRWGAPLVGFGFGALLSGIAVAVVGDCSGTAVSDRDGAAPTPVASIPPAVRSLAYQGDANAQFDLGLAYNNGEGVPKDSRQAALWYRKAAEQGHAGAQNNLGVRYDKGDGVPKDAGEAALWYRKAAEQGNAFAQDNLGSLYRDGRGVPKDADEAALWYRKAAEQGHGFGQANLGWCYQNGVGVAKDASEAARWYERAARAGNAFAQSNLGWLYEVGSGVPKHGGEAKRWYRKAAEQGDMYAQYNLGRLLRNADSIQAYAWFNLSAAQGIEDAARARTDLQRYMTAVQIARAQELSRKLVD